MAGFETTATLLGWAIHDLARDPASQERLVAEGGVFTDAVITEARLHPPSPPRRRQAGLGPPDSSR